MGQANKINMEICIEYTNCRLKGEFVDGELTTGTILSQDGTM